MALQRVRSLIVVGCGDFGSLVLDTLAQRNRPPLRPVEPLRLLGRGASRGVGAEQFAVAADRFAAELQVALKGHAGAAFALVFAAEEAVGSGLALAALEWLGRGEQRPMVWLALPPAGADAVACARTYATLLELESLRSQDRLGYCCLRQGREEPAEAAARFADALLVNLEPPTPPGYAGFGTGIHVHGRAFWTEQLARSLVRRELTKLAEPGSAVDGDDLKRRWERLWSSLLAPLQDTRFWHQRWSMTSRQMFSAYSDEYTVPELLEAQANFYQRSFDWTVKLKAHWDEAVDSFAHQLWADCNELFAGGMIAGQAALAAAVTSAAEALDLELQRCTGTEQSLAPQVRDLHQRLSARTAGLLGRRRRPDDAEQLYRLDELLVQHRWEFCRKNALTRVLDYVKTLLEELGPRLAAERERVRGWQAALPHVAPLAEPRTAHVLLVPLPEGAADRLLGEVSGDNLRRALAEPAPEASDAAAGRLLHTAREDVRRATLPFEWPEPDPEARARWAQAVLPSLPTVQPLTVYLLVSSTLPTTLRNELEKQVHQTAQAVDITWFDYQDLVFTSTAELALAALADLPEWQEAYAAAGAGRPGLHALPEPPGGWQRIAATPAAPAPAPAAPEPDRSALSLGASVLLHGIALGLVTSTGESGCAVRYLDRSGESLVVRPLGSLTAALNTIAQDAEMRQSLQDLTERWLTTLGRERVPGLAALFSWYEEHLFVPPPRAPDPPELALLRDACRQGARALEVRLAATGPEWAQRSRALRAAIGTDADACSLPAGEWRYLHW